MKEIFPSSRNLKLVFEQYGWDLYDITIPGDRVQPLSWDEIESRDPAQQFELFHRYAILPNPQKDERLRTAYYNNKRKGIYAALGIPRTKPRRGIKAYGGCAFNGADYFLLNELHFGENNVQAFAHPFVAPPYSSRVTIPSKKTIDAFAQFFSIIKFEKKEITLLDPLRDYLN